MSTRPIDIYEPAILRVLERCDAGEDLDGACQWESGFVTCTSGRLKSLVEMWCLIGGVEVPK